MINTQSGKLIASTPKRTVYGNGLLFIFLIGFLLFGGAIFILFHIFGMVSVKGINVYSIALIVIPILLYGWAILISIAAYQGKFPGIQGCFKLYENGFVPHKLPLKLLLKKDKDEKTFIHFTKVEKIEKVKARMVRSLGITPRIKREMEELKRKRPDGEIKITEDYIEALEAIEIFLKDGGKIWAAPSTVGKEVFNELRKKATSERYHTQKVSGI